MPFNVKLILNLYIFIQAVELQKSIFHQQKKVLFKSINSQINLYKLMNKLIKKLSKKN